MDISYMNQGDYAPIALADGRLTVAGLEVDLAALQGDTEKTIDISRGPDGEPVVGLGSGWYLANIVLPPVRYLETVSGSDPETGEPVVDLERRPLDENLVRVNLWALPSADQKQGE